MNYGCQQDRLELPAFEQSVIEYLCQQANSLGNCAIYALKRATRQAGRVESNYYELDKHLKENRHYKGLFSQAAQQTLTSICESFSSYEALLQKWFKGELADKPKPPRYRKSGGLAGFSYPAQHLGLNEALETGMIRLPLGSTIKRLEGVSEIFIPAPTNIHPDRIREVRIFPRNRCFYVEWIYQREVEQHNLNPANALGIDPGVKNWLTCVSTQGESFIIDGRQPNFWNHTLNREVAKHNEGYWSKKLALMTEKRNRRMRDYINKAARKIANYCIANDIGTVVFGWNKGSKTGVNIGKRNNQNFVQLPTAKLKNRLKAVLKEIGVRFVETEESYTSKASFLDGDSLPVYGEKPDDWKPSGKRTTTKLYRTAKGWIINADCNGAANILRKVASILGLDLSKITRGAVTRPLRLNLYPTVFV